MNSVKSVRRNDYSIINFLGAIIWVMLAIASALLMIVMLVAVFSGSPIIILPVIIIVPFMLAVKAITEAIKHGLAIVWRAIRRLRLADPGINLDKVCFQRGDTVRLTITGLPSFANSVEVQFVNRIDTVSTINLIFAQVEFIGIQEDNLVEVATNSGINEYILHIPQSAPKALASRMFVSRNLPFIPNYSHQEEVWVARVKIVVSGWINFDEYYPIALC